MEHDHVKEHASELRRISVKLTASAARYAVEISQDPNINRVVSRNPLGDATREIDSLIEKHVIESIREMGLSVKLISEEIGEVTIGSDPQLLMILDPLDGSLNYVTQTPYCTVSLAIAPYRGSRNVSLDNVVAGSISEIFREATYSFSIGDGAFINGERASAVDQYRRSNIALIYIDRPDIYSTLYRALKEINGVKIRSMGSASLDIVKTALSYYIAFIDLRGKLRNVDVAAAYGFARELKAPITFLDKDVSEIPINTLSTIGSIIVSRDQKIHRIILDKLSG